MAKVVSGRVRLDFGKGLFPRGRLGTEQVPREWSQHQAWLSLRNICTTAQGRGGILVGGSVPELGLNGPGESFPAQDIL